ncbi:SCO family protein [Sulfurihydrogenibium azorense]|uniref:SCO family protein n=1 Tax=Sulfurihydrogenibium azorense TaxID=309806 RepID=UPI00240A6B45|nr:SCO family protein [Sulfurihydrogenibium azorense]MDM7274126.1 SCO family protein [Sulfurihydrogenibium azorense]
MKKLLSFLIVLVFSTVSIAYNLQGSVKGYPKPVIEVENLVNEEGKPTKLSDFKGKVVILYFGFTNCQHVCPTVSASLKRISDALVEKGLKDKFQIVFITVDPKRDTPEVLKEYKKSHEFDTFTFLTGKEEDLKKVWKAYGIEVKEKEMEMKHGDHVMKHKMISHTPVITFIIDKNGKIVEDYKGIYLPEDKIIQDIEYLIKK